MVDVTGKEVTIREATAETVVHCSAPVLRALRDGTTPKGDVFAVARISGINAAKKVPELLPLAHVIGIHGAIVDVDVTDDGVRITATVRAADRTGVEMEALTAATVAGLALIDMVKGRRQDGRDHLGAGTDQERWTIRTVASPGVTASNAPSFWCPTAERGLG